ncbi:MAG: hypothetical protein KA161_10490 [Saprospiraceae bacterium]|nr:hypothetical protein [Saprospiraceae bacterium]
MDKKIVLLACKGQSTNIVFNSLNNHFGNISVILEEKESLKVYLKRRVRKLGIAKVLGQTLFQLLIAKPLQFFSRKRIAEIVSKNLLDSSEIPPEKITRVHSINSIETIEILKNSNPDLIIVNGTRIISKNVLASVSCRLINIHAGITPKYRGVHGAYWALVKADFENCGVTVHFVDKGIDTGNIISQGKIEIRRNDNFATYPFLQLSRGLELLHKAIVEYFANSIESKKNTLDSYLWYHPTIWEYIYYRIFKKVK